MGRTGNAVPRSIWAIIPVKTLSQSKTRLASLLTPAERAALTAHLLENTLHELRTVPALAQILVVSRDEAVLHIAQAHQALTLKEQPPYTLRTAVTQATNYATLQTVKSALIMPADLPFLQGQDVQNMIAQAVSPSSCIICPDEKINGTNALLVPTGRNYRFQYGVNSYQKHLLEAHSLNLKTITLTIPSIAFDLDTADDWQIYQQTLGRSVKPDRYIQN